ncbi:MAG: hypothetical protein MZV63_07480 [Marinilabiliales bacterium]|nr:hypothetical protein [Marinilabiliales bacterium]
MGAATLAVSAGAGLITAHPQGFSNAAGTGTVQVTGTRNYNTGADYTYNGSAPQATGSGLTGSRNLTINNNSGVTLSGNTSVSGTLGLTSGVLGLSGADLTITASGIVPCGGAGSINGNTNSNYIINSTAINGFPSGTYYNVIKNGNSVVTMCGDATINNILTLNNGALNVSDKTLTLNGPRLQDYQLTWQQQTFPALSLVVHQPA